MEKVKILHVLEAGRYSGPNSTISRLVNALQDRYEFIVMFSDDDSERFKSEFNPDYVIVLQTKLTRIRSGILNVIRYVLGFLPELFKIYQAIRSYRPDIVHAHTYLDVKAVVVARLLKVPTIWQLHLDKPDNRFEILYRFVAYFFGTNFISVSEATRNGFDVGTYSRGLNVVIQSAVDREQFKPRSKSEIQDSITVVSIGNFHPRKGFDKVIDLALLTGSLPFDVKFRILGRVFTGSEAYFNRLRERIANLGLQNVELIANADVVQTLESADIFMLTSTSEASPFVVWEAASCGLPILSTDVGDVKDFIESYDAGLLIDSNDTEYNLKQLHELVMNYESFRKGTLLMAVKEFSLDVIAEKYHEAYQKVVKND